MQLAYPVPPRRPAPSCPPAPRSSCLPARRTEQRLGHKRYSRGTVRDYLDNIFCSDFERALKIIINNLEYTDHSSALSNCRSPDFKKSNGSNKKIWRGSIIGWLFGRLFGRNAGPSWVQQPHPILNVVLQTRPDQTRLSI